MKFIDIIRLALRIFKKNRLRTLLTVLGIAVGIGSIVYLVSLGYGLQEVTINQISRLSALKALTVSPSPNSMRVIDDAALAEIAQIDGVKTVGPVGALPVQVNFQDQVGDINLFLANPNYFDLEGMTFKVGVGFSEDGASQVVATSGLIDLFNLSQDEILDQPIEIIYYPLNSDGAQGDVEKRAELTIVGVVEEESALIYANLSPFKADMGVYQEAKVEAANESQAPEIQNRINAIGFQASTVIETVEQLSRGFRYVRVFFAALGIIALVVAAIGMFNTLTISLLERIREIGIMKALGAADIDIWKLFLAEAGLIGFLGGVGGVILGVVFGWVTNLIFNLLAASLGGNIVGLFITPIRFGLIIVLFALIIGIITGIYPARRAARLNPIDALRYE